MSSHLPPSPRHLEVERLVLKGLSVKEISAILNIAPSTTRCHVTELLHRRGCRDRRELIADRLFELQGLVKDIAEWAWGMPVPPTSAVTLQERVAAATGVKFKDYRLVA